jgi:hypothetical protein
VEVSSISDNKSSSSRIFVFILQLSGVVEDRGTESEVILGGHFVLEESFGVLDGDLESIELQAVFSRTGESFLEVEVLERELLDRWGRCDLFEESAIRGEVELLSTDGVIREGEREDIIHYL